MTSNESIKQFALKTLIVTVAVVGALWLTLNHLDNLIDQRVYEMTSALSNTVTFRPKIFWPRMEATIEKAADPAYDLSPERKAKLLSAIRVLRARWKPVLDELTTDPAPEV